jgi:hypothetical protein
MPETESQALWRISEFDRLRSTAATTPHPGMQRQTLLSTTLRAELRVLDRRREGGDILEVVAACVRLREPALIYLQCEGSIWPVTVFPQQMLYHSPRHLALATRREMKSLRIIDVEAPGVRPPGHWMHERIASDELYHPLTPALWALALQGPRTTLLHEIGGTAAYRALRHPSSAHDMPMTGALGPAVERLHRQSLSLSRIAREPGMSTERASRLLNALYLTSNLIVSRAHQAARADTLQWLIGRIVRFGRQ